MKKSTILFAALTVAATVSAKVPKEYRDSVRADGLYNVFVISGGEPTAALLAEDNWVFPDDISKTSKPDSELNIIFRPSGKIAACKKAIITKLFPTVKTYILNGKKISRERFDVIPAAFFNSVDFSNDTLRIETRKDVNASSPAWTALYNESQKWQLHQYDLVRTNIISLALGNAVPNDFSTYPPEMLIPVNNYIHLPAQIARMAGPDAGVQIIGLGDLVMVSVNPSGNINIEKGRDGLARYAWFDKLPVGMTVNELIARSGIPANEVNVINIGPDHCFLGSFKPQSNPDSPYIGQWQQFSENDQPQTAYLKNYYGDGTFDLLHVEERETSPNTKVCALSVQQKGLWSLNGNVITEQCAMGRKGNVMLTSEISGDTLTQTFVYNERPDELYVQKYVYAGELPEHLTNSKPQITIDFTKMTPEGIKNNLPLMTLPGLNADVTRHIVSHIRYPEQAAIDNRSGSVAYRVTVDNHGFVRSHEYAPELSTPDSEDFARAGEAVFKGMPALNPAIFNNHPCNVKGAVMRLVFHLGGEQPTPLATSPLEIH